MKGTGLERLMLLVELENIQRRGVMIFLEGTPCDPVNAAEQLCVTEQNSFMRDYITDDKGVLTELRFDRITKL